MKESPFFKDVYPVVRGQMKSGDTILWRSNTLLGATIRLFSHADVNHDSLVTLFPELGVDRVMITEALAHGIVPNSLTESLKRYNGMVFWLQLKDEYNDARFNIRKWAVERFGKPYDYWSLIRQMWTRVRPDGKKLFCSEFDFLAKRDGGGIECLKNIKYAPRPGDMEKLGIYEPRIRIK